MSFSPNGRFRSHFPQREDPNSKKELLKADAAQIDFDRPSVERLLSQRRIARKEKILAMSATFALLVTGAAALGSVYWKIRQEERRATALNTRQIPTMTKEETAIMKMEARNSRQAGDLDFALRIINHLLYFEPDNADLWYDRAECCSEMKNYAVARESYERAKKFYLDQPPSDRSLYRMQLIDEKLKKLPGVQ